MSEKNHFKSYKNRYLIYSGLLILAIVWILLNIFIYDYSTPPVLHFDLFHITCVIEFIIMVIYFFILLLNVKLCRSFKKSDKRVFKWLTLSCFSFFIFIIIENFIHILPEPSLLLTITQIIAYIFYLPYLLFSLVFLYLILANFILIERSSIITLFLLAIFSISIIVYIGTSFSWWRPFSAYTGSSHALLALLETFLYDFIIICLINAKDRAVQIILLGKIILIAASLWLLYAFIVGDGYIYLYFHNKQLIFNLWVFGDFYYLFGLIVILCGYIIMCYNKNNTIEHWFRQTNSIISRLVSLIFAISMISFILFFIFSYTFSVIDKSFFFTSPFFLIIYSIIVIIPSVFVGQYFESPFKKIINNINILLEERNKQNMDNSFSIMEFVFLQKFIRRSFETIKEKNIIKRQLVDLASQVAHDIRSPLTALDMILMDLPEMEEEKRVIVRNATTRIRDIANHLLSQKNPLEKIEYTTQACLLADIIDTSVSEKRFQLSKKADIHLEFKCSPTSYQLFSNINSTEFRSILSNLMNNSLEALADAGSINLELIENKSHAIITIKDDGAGISPEILAQLGERGITDGKKNGCGLGVAHAISNIKSWRGDITFESTLGKGTTVIITLPLCQSPSWFLKEIVISQHTEILILDDDSSIHQVWNTRFKSLKLKNKHIHWRHFYSIAQLENWLTENSLSPNCLILCDYEIIGSKKNGLELLEELRLTKNAILVTSRYEQPDIHTDCEKLGIKLLPKFLSAFVSIVIT